jgi:DNA-binding LacI/PurR family transcriptional regulator
MPVFLLAISNVVKTPGRTLLAVPGSEQGAVSLRHVAARAGVSIKTVSNVVNGYVHVAPSTRARVQQVLDELNYRPNLSARNLRSARTGLVALAVPEIDSPYFAELARHVVRAAQTRGWTVLIDQTDGLADRERLVMDGIRGHLIDGVIFSPLASGREQLLTRRDSTPMVLLGERVYDGPVDHVAIDNVGAARVAVEHLLGLGRRRVAAIGEQRQESAGTARLRARGYADALRGRGIEPDRALVRFTESYHREDGAAAMADLLDSGAAPDAVFCFNDLMALGALRSLAERGLRVPDDVAVVGFDDIEDGRYSIPSLTTVRPDKQVIAEHAVDLLAGRLDGTDTGEPHEVDAPFALVVRESTRGRPK